jgi:hypothetical protein
MRQYLKGGKGDKLSYKNVDKEQLKLGIKHELEHTDNSRIAAEIALDHLAEDPKYYSNLKNAGIDENKINLKQIYLREVNAKIVTMLKTRWKQENRNLDDEQMDYYLQRFEQLKNNPKITNKDITKYSWHDLEHLIDSFPVKPGKEFKKNSAEVDGDLVYDKNNIKIYSGKTMKQCITYANNEKYSWCISRTNVASNLYTNYRFGSNPRSFYFVFDQDKPDTKSGGEFISPIHAFVVHAEEDGEYGFSNANNTGDTNNLSWDGLGAKIKSFKDGSSTWEKMKGLESLFKYIPPTEEESEIAMMKGKHLSDEQFLALNYRLKTAYINLGRELNGNTFSSLDNDLKNLYINQGHVIDFEWIKDSLPLIKRFITLQIRDKNPINEKYLSYFTPEQKDWFFKNILFDKNVESQYIDYGMIVNNFPEQEERYIDFKIKNLDYLPPDSIKALSPEQLKKYNYYNIIYINTTIESNIDSKYNTKTFYALSNFFNLEQYIKFPYKKEFESLLINNISDESEFRHFLPPLIINNNKAYFILENKNNSYCLVDSNGNILDISDNYNLSPDLDNEVIFNNEFELTMGKNKYDNNNLNSIKEEISRLKRLAGITK